MKKEELNSLLNEKKPVEYEVDDATLAKTIEFVKMAHGDTEDKMGFPYYTHPYRVCKLLKERFGDTPMYTEKQINFACMIALLHDVVEDTDYGYEDIAKNLELTETQYKEMKYVLGFVTHDKNTLPYSEYIRKIAEAPIIFPVWVKFCDLLDNGSPERALVTEGFAYTGEDFNRLNRYLISTRIMMKRLAYKGDDFKCNDEEIALINNYRTRAERERMSKFGKIIKKV